jgi:hypothetical protein
LKLATLRIQGQPLRRHGQLCGASGFSSFANE